jgi:hypothetical protein
VLTAADLSSNIIEAFPNVDDLAGGSLPYIGEAVGIPPALIDYASAGNDEDLKNYLNNVIAHWVCNHNLNTNKTTIVICCMKLVVLLGLL